MPGREYPAGRVTMKMECPHCGVRGTVADSLIGKRVKCPKCKEIFQVMAEGASAIRDNEPVTESAIGTAESAAGTKSSPGMTAQDEANLEEELAKIFDDMKKESESLEEEYDEGQEAESATAPEGMGFEDEVLNEEELQSQLEDMLDEKCSVCGTIVGKSDKHELYGNIYCRNCLPGSEDDEEGRELALSKGAEQDEESPGALKKLGKVLAGIVIIGLIVAAGYYFTMMM